MGDHTSHSQNNTQGQPVCHTSVEQSAQSRFLWRPMDSEIRKGHEVSTRGSWKGQGSRELSIPPAMILGFSHYIRPQSQPHVTMARVPLHVPLVPNIPATHLWPLPDPMMYREPQP